MNKDWCFEPLKKYGGYIQTEEEYEEVKKIIEENLHKDKNEDKLITIHKTLLEEKDKEIERLKAREQECIDKYLNMSKYASEMEGKYITEKYIIDELEKWLKEHSIVDYNCNENIIHEQIALGLALDILIELKERVNND